MLLINATFAALANCSATMITRLKQVGSSAGLLALLFALPAGAQSAIPVYEFYHTTLDHYFRTADAGEATGIDNGAAGAGWVRTGDNFLAYPANSFPAGAAPVCRFYGSVNPGPNSHFYTSDKAECDGLKALQASTPATQKRWNYEGLAFAIVPGTGTSCPSGLKPVYRLYNNGHTRGKDSNHRYTTLLNEYTSLQTGVWKGEGVVMCAAVEGGTAPLNPPLPTGTPPASLEAQIKEFLALGRVEREQKLRTLSAQVEREWVTISGLEAELGGAAAADAAYASVANYFVNAQLRALANAAPTPKRAATIKNSETLGEGLASAIIATLLNGDLAASLVDRSKDLKPGESTTDSTSEHQITASLERQTTDFTSKYDGANGAGGKMSTQVDMMLCPDAAGAFTIKSKFEISMAKAGGTSGFKSTLALSITGHVNDNADLVYSDIEARIETADFTNGKGAYIDATSTFSSGESTRPFSRTVNRTGGRLTDEFVDLALFVGTMQSVTLADKLLKAAETAFKSGRCVILQPTTNPSQRTGLQPSASVAISAAPRSKIDGGPVGGNVTASLAGEAAVAPSGTKVPADASFTYTAADTANKSGTVSLEARSKRGIAKADVAFNTGGDSWKGTASFKDEHFTASAEMTWTLASTENNISMYKNSGTGTIAYSETDSSGTCSHPATSGTLGLDGNSTTGVLFIDYNSTPPTYHGAAAAGIWPVTITCVQSSGTTSYASYGGSLLFGGSKGIEGVEAVGSVTVPFSPDAPMTIEGSDTDGMGGVFNWKFTRVK